MSYRFTVLAACLIMPSVYGAKVPSYKVDSSSRDPFTRSELMNRARHSQSNAAIQSAVEVELSIKGVMVGGDKKKIGIFSKGMFKVGDVAEIQVNGKMIEMTLIELDMTKISAVFRSGGLVYKVRKEN